MAERWMVMVESNTTGSGRLFFACSRALGLRPLLLTRDPSRFPYLDTDQIASTTVDTTDPAAVLRVCAGLSGRIAGVISSSEYYVATAAAVARDLGLLHTDPAAVLACRDKHRQRVTLRRSGVGVPAFAGVQTAQAAVAAADEFGFPVVVKPTAGSGSVATRLCVTASEVAGAAREALAASSRLPAPAPASAMVEEYLAGPEYSVEVLDGQPIGVTAKHVGALPYFVEMGHDFPAVIDPRRERRLMDAATAAVEALGLKQGPAHVELRYTTAGPRVVEVNPRLAGGMIPRLVQEATGQDLVMRVVAAAAGLGPWNAPAPVSTRAASIRFLVAEHGGRVSGIVGVNEAQSMPNVVAVEVVPPPPDGRLILRHSFEDRLGYVIAAAVDGRSAACAADRARAALAIQYEYQDP